LESFKSQKFSSSFFLTEHTIKINQESIFSSFFFVLVKTLERKKPRTIRKQTLYMARSKKTLDMEKSKENPRITCNNEK
jgi:hypothetical protein